MSESMKIAFERVVDALKAHGDELEQIERDVSKIPDLVSALNILNKTLVRLADAVERTETAVGYARADIELIQKHGCKHGCGGPDDGEPTNPEALVQLRAVGDQ
jgi:uncharacterized protein YukE